ncbi:MAG: acylphosphatase [Bacteroidetes bacterium]|nr:acylphosphatase [Bacteroidota bacterium]
MSQKQVKIIVTGKVQGVYFRKFTQIQAKTLGVTGYVKNQADGSVFIYASGTEDQLKELEKWCYKGSPFSKVEKVDVRATHEQESHSGFEIF